MKYQYWSNCNFQYLKAITRRCSVTKVFLKISKNSQENTCTRVSFLIKLQSSACNFIKQESRTQVFSCEIWETFKKTFLCRTPVVIAFQYCLPIKALWVLSTHKLFYSRNRFSHIFKIYRKRLVARKWVDAYSAAVFQRCSVEIFFKKFRKIHKKTPVPESLFY